MRSDPPHIDYLQVWVCWHGLKEDQSKPRERLQSLEIARPYYQIPDTRLSQEAVRPACLLGWPLLSFPCTPHHPEETPSPSIHLLLFAWVPGKLWAGVGRKSVGSGGGGEKVLAHCGVRLEPSCRNRLGFSVINIWCHSVVKEQWVRLAGLCLVCCCKKIYIFWGDLLKQRMFWCVVEVAI